MRTLIFNYVLTAFFIAALVTSTASADVLTNGNFDAQDTSGGDIGASSGITGWSTIGDPGTMFVSSQTGTPAVSDPNLFKVFGFDGGGVFLFQDFGSGEGWTWNGSAEGHLPTGDPIPMGSADRGFIQIQFLDSSGGFAGAAAGGNSAEGFNTFTSNLLDPTGTAYDTWTTLGVGTAPAPDGTVTARFLIGKTNVGQNGGSMYFDDATFNLVSVPEPGSVAVLCLASLGMIVRRRR